MEKSSRNDKDGVVGCLAVEVFQRIAAAVDPPPPIDFEEETGQGLEHLKCHESSMGGSLKNLAALLEASEPIDPLNLLIM